MSACPLINDFKWGSCISTNLHLLPTSVNTKLCWHRLSRSLNMNSPTCIFNLCCLLVFHSAFWVTCLICFYLILTVFKANWLTSLKANLSSLLLGLFFSPTLSEKLCQCCLTSLCISNLSVKPILYSASFGFSNCWECARRNTLIWKQSLCDVILWFTLI